MAATAFEGVEGAVEGAFEGDNWGEVSGRGMGRSVGVLSGEMGEKSGSCGGSCGESGEMGRSDERVGWQMSCPPSGEGVLEGAIDVSAEGCRG